VNFDEEINCISHAQKFLIGIFGDAHMMPKKFPKDRP
jgi:hypothetical protein